MASFDWPVRIPPPESVPEGAPIKVIFGMGLAWLLGLALITGWEVW